MGVQGLQNRRIQARGIAVSELHLQRAWCRVSAGEGAVSSLCFVCVSMGYVSFLRSVFLGKLADKEIAHRTLITRKLKGLEDIIPVTSVHWHMGEKGNQPFRSTCMIR